MTPSSRAPGEPPLIDLNCDLGEDFGAWAMGDDEALLSIVTSANIACGFHAGDLATMERVCWRAAENDVAIGAHIGYRDLADFGRRPIAVDPDELISETIYQISALDGFARLAGSHVSYVKPHGALYHTVTHDSVQAAALAEAAHRYNPELAVPGLPGSQVLRQTELRGLRGVVEAFADRAYTADGTLLPRGEPGAVIHDPATVVGRCVDMALSGKVATHDGSPVRLAPRSLCVHGDTPGAVEIAGAVRSALLDGGVRLAPYSLTEDLRCAS
ncbi:LamB/YcsF family protein [Streptomyces sioyaensis]|uniref:LamB/YcsF family protein n=1 Tax=Streptomyces sioyaensis TaxID=67364 RepID=UPI00378B1EBA